MRTRQDDRPTVQRRPFRMRNRVPEAGPVDQFFFIVSGIAAVWLTIFLLVEGFRWSWSNWLFFVLFWVTAAYLTLPRLHRILSDIYVPNYFIGRTRTSDGLLGDPVNLALRGDEARLHHAMRNAGWTLADELTLESAWRIVKATVGRRSYPHAPVSPLLLFGRQQDFAYQEEVNKSPGRRHHVRFWRCPEGWMLPGGHRVDWLAGATFDRAVGFSLFTLQITHKIDADIDVERDYVTRSLRESVPGTELTVLKDFTTGYHARNGGGDTIHTDGDLPVIELAAVPGDLGGDDHRQERPLRISGKPLALEDTKESRRRPLSILGGAALVLAAAAVSIAIGLGDLLQTGRVGLPRNSTVDQLISATTVLALLAQLVLITFTLRGRRLSRLLLMSVLLVSIAAGLVGHFGLLRTPAEVDLATVALQIAALMLLSSNSSREYALAARRLRQDTRAIRDSTQLW